MTIAAILVIFPFCMIYAAVSDLLSMTIANRVSLLLIVVFAIAAPLTGMEWQDIAMHFAVAAGVLVVTFSLFAIGAMGGGDAKLMASTALWFGYGTALIEYFVYSAIYGGMLTLLLVFYRNSPIAVLNGHRPYLQKLSDSDAGIPYGIALGASGLYTFPNSPLGNWVLTQLSTV